MSLIYSTDEHDTSIQFLSRQKFGPAVLQWRWNDKLDKVPVCRRVTERQNVAPADNLELQMSQIYTSEEVLFYCQLDVMLMSNCCLDATFM